MSIFCQCTEEYWYRPHLQKKKICLLCGKITKKKGSISKHDDYELFKGFSIGSKQINELFPEHFIRSDYEHCRHGLILNTCSLCLGYLQTNRGQSGPRPVIAANSFYAFRRNFIEERFEPNPIYEADIKK